MGPALTDWIQAMSALLTMIAAFTAARIAWKAPKLAASYAEQYRRETAIGDEQRALQMWVFRALMKGRAEILHQDTRAAINLVEAAFPAEPKVREARRMFTKMANAKPFDSNALVQSYLTLVEAVTGAVGLGGQIDRFDIESGYYPEALGVLDQAALAEASEKIARKAAAEGDIRHF